MCLRNLFRRRLRTSLCILGIALGIMLIISVGATTRRYMDVIKEMNLFYSGEVVVIPKGSFFIQAFPIGGSLLESTVEKVRQVEGVKTAVPMLFVIGASTSEGIIQPVPANISVGIPTGNWSVLVGSTPLKLGGRWPSADSSEKEVVVGGYLAWSYNLTVNSKIRIRGHDLRVVGILDKSPVLLTRIIIMPLDIAQDIYRYTGLVSMIDAEPQEGVTQEELKNEIEEGISDVIALTGDERNEIVEPMFRDIELWNLGIRIVIFLISMVLVMTVATMNISERRKELATLDAIGAPKSSIIRMIVTETGLIGLFGGIVGTLLGAVAALFLASFYGSVPVSFMFPSLFVIVSPTMMLEILASTVALSCIAGIIPAVATVRKNIAEVLRSEY